MSFFQTTHENHLKNHPKSTWKTMKTRWKTTKNHPKTTWKTTPKPPPDLSQPKKSGLCRRPRPRHRPQMPRRRLALPGPLRGRWAVPEVMGENRQNRKRWFKINTKENKQISTVLDRQFCFEATFCCTKGPTFFSGVFLRVLCGSCKAYDLAKVYLDCIMSSISMY